MRPLHRARLRRHTWLTTVSTLMLMAAVSTTWLAPATSARVGGRPADFTLSAIPGGPTSERFHLGDHLGRRPVIVLFWDSLCAHCRRALPFYQQLHERLGSSGLVVVGVCVDGPRSLARAGGVARRLGVTFPLVSDLDSSVASRLNPRRATPFAIFVGRNARIVLEREGFSPSESRDLTTRAERLLAR